MASGAGGRGPVGVGYELRLWRAGEHLEDQRMSNEPPGTSIYVHGRPQPGRSLAPERGRRPAAVPFLRRC